MYTDGNIYTIYSIHAYTFIYLIYTQKFSKYMKNNTHYIIKTLSLFIFYTYYSVLQFRLVQIDEEKTRAYADRYRQTF